jgi:hypothetical protein
MNKFVIFAACFAFGTAGPALAQTSSCFNTRMLNSSGATIRLQTGQSYVVGLGADRTKASVWLPLANVTVCRGDGSAWEITNTDLARPQTIMAISK